MEHQQEKPLLAAAEEEEKKTPRPGPRRPGDPPRLIAAHDESGCLYVYGGGGSVDSIKGEHDMAGSDNDNERAKFRSRRSRVRALLDVFLPAGYPHTVTPDYTPYQIYDSLQAFSSTIAGLLSSRAVLQGFGVGDSGSSATAAVLLTVLQESTGRLATILFAHRAGRAIEAECKFYRFLADILNDSALVLDVLSPALGSVSSPPLLKTLALCSSGVLRALCGVSGGAAKASLSAHFARNGNLAELNAKDGSQETVISLLGMLAGSVFVRYVQDPATVWFCMFVLVAIHLWTNYRAVRSVQMRTLNRQRATIVVTTYLDSGRVLRPDEVARQEGILWWNEARGVKPSFAKTYPRPGEISQRDLEAYEGSRYIITSRKNGRNGGGEKKIQTSIFLKDGADTLDALRAWVEAVAGPRSILEQEDFWRAIVSAGWDLTTNALETGPAIRLVVG